MKKLLLPKGQFTLVDDDDFEWLNQWKWSYGGIGYVARRTYLGKKDGKYKYKYTSIYLHRIIMNAPHDKEIDHINGNKLDNRKENLRIVNPSQNHMNSDKRTQNTSGYKGVTWHKYNKRWQVQINVYNKSIYVGNYKNKIDAALAYNKAVKKYYGEFARLNQI